ncbi:trafficking protein particle complex subunit 6A isoform X3 [Equus quagga]|uniref:trafficking protein particle complex subunit 6A isoform X3 n=1 Tax=Equus quagga TaxID=89248 RepID=UPI001EE1A504|nr:trafficking protein particle complex subunit 6A isoform X3 [Equus quagga]
MADAVLFEFLHTEMVAELWAHDPDPGPGVHREQRHARVPTATCSASASCPPGCGALCVRKVGRAPTPTELPPSPGSAPVSPLLAHPGTEYEPVCAGGHGLPCGPGPGREPGPATPQHQPGPSVCRCPPGCPGRRWPTGRSWTSSSSCAKTCGWPCSRSRWTASAPTTRLLLCPGDLRPAGQQFPPPHPDGLRPAVSGGSTQVTCAPRPQFLAFTCGLLRGTLCTLGVKSLVTASVAALPACKFQVVIQKS